jgi:hypothetical protein
VERTAEPPIHLITIGAPVAPFLLAADPWGPNGYYGSQFARHSNEALALCHERGASKRAMMDGSR